MTEQTNVMQDALVSIIQKTQQGIDASVSFLSEQIPDVIQQLLLWKFVQAVVITIIMVVLVTLYFKMFKRVWKYTEEHLDGWDQGPARGAYGFVGGFGALVAGCAGVDNFLTALQIYVAPKVYLIEYAASLVK